MVPSLTVSSNDLDTTSKSVLISGRVLALQPGMLRLGRAHRRELLAHGTLYAHLVASDEGDERAFLAEVGAGLRVPEKLALAGSWGWITTTFEVEAPDVARKAQPGQFIILRVVPEGERVPLTIADYAWSKDMSKLLLFTNTKRVWRAETRGDVGHRRVDLSPEGIHRDQAVVTRVPVRWMTGVAGMIEDCGTVLIPSPTPLSSIHR